MLKRRNKLFFVYFEMHLLNIEIYLCMSAKVREMHNSKINESTIFMQLKVEFCRLAKNKNKT